MQQFITQFQDWADMLVGYLPNLVLAVIVLTIFYIIARVISSISQRAMGKVTKKRAGVRRLIGGTIFFLIILAGLFIALSVLNLDKTVSSLLAGVGIAGIALGFAFQDIAANYISGIIIAFSQPFKEGDLLETNSYFGKVKHIDLRSTQMMTLDGLDVIIPNKDVLQSVITNYTSTNDRRVTIMVGVSYAEDLEHVEKVCQNALKNVKLKNNKKPVEIFFDEFSDSSINIRTRFWITEATQVAYRTAKSDAILKIRKAFTKEGITIPFPIRTLDFGIKGGQSLGEIYTAQKK